MTYTFEARIDAESWRRALADDVRRGLGGRRKSLPPKYFYDRRGAALFDRITELPEYGLTRAEHRLLRAHAGEVMERTRPVEIVEIGAGSAAKVRALLDAADGWGRVVRYVPVDVNRSAPAEAARALAADWPRLHVHGVIGDFQRHLAAVPPPVGRRLVVFFGSTIGNLDDAERHALLRQVRGLLGAGGRLLLGVDLVKDPARLQAAYDDAAGVTAAFNRNLLRVVNRGLGGDFRPEAFRHRALYDRTAARVEMHLVPVTPQVVRLRDLGLTLELSPDETIWTESSYKFTPPAAEAMLAAAGLGLERWYSDGEFALALAAAA